MGIEVRIYDQWGWDPADPHTVLTEDKARQVHDAKNDVGSWSFALPRDSAEIAAVEPNSIVRFFVDGVQRFQGRVGPWDQTTISDGEESSELRTVSGPGLLATLKDGIVGPGPQQGRLVSDTRFFNFASPEYGATPDLFFWSAAYELWQQGDNVNSLYGADTPEDWPDPTAYWIWDRNIDLGLVPPMPVGDVFFRTEVTLSEGDYSLFIAADDGYSLWVDGVLQAAQTEAFQFRQTHKVDLFLEAGTHTIGIKGTNIERVSAATNGAGVVFAMYSTVDGGQLDTLVLHSDSTWMVLGYPTTSPGFTAGEILRILMEEAIDRDALQNWWYAFDDVYDYNGNAWTDRIEIGFRIGDETYLDVVRKMAETYVDVAVSDDVYLRAVNKGGWNTGPAVTFDVGDHVLDLHHANDPAYATDILVHQADGTYRWTTSGFGAPYGGAGPRIEAGLEAGSSPSDLSTDRLAEGIFDRFAQPKRLVPFSILPDSSTRPWADWWCGKVVQMADESLGLVDSEITAVVVADVSDESDGETEGSYVVSGEALQ